jgi:hypothetical protein
VRLEGLDHFEKNPMTSSGLEPTGDNMIIILPNKDTYTKKLPKLHYNMFLYNVYWSFPELVYCPIVSASSEMPFPSLHPAFYFIFKVASFICYKNP